MHNYIQFVVEWLNDEENDALAYLIIPEELFNVF